MALNRCCGPYSSYFSNGIQFHAVFLVDLAICHTALVWVPICPTIIVMKVTHHTLSHSYHYPHSKPKPPNPWRAPPSGPQKMYGTCQHRLVGLHLSLWHTTIRGHPFTMPPLCSYTPFPLELSMGRSDWLLMHVKRMSGCVCKVYLGLKRETKPYLDIPLPTGET